MGVVRTVRSGGRTRREIVQTYRWGGKVCRKSVRLPLRTSGDLANFQRQVDQKIWDSTYLPLFDSIKKAATSRTRVIPSSLAEKELDDFILAFTYNTNRIEGSTLSLEDTRQLLQGELVPRSKPIRDVLEALAHAKLL